MWLECVSYRFAHSSQKFFVAICVYYAEIYMYHGNAFLYA